MIGQFLKGQRSDSRTTLVQVANKVGVSQPYLSNIERGDRLPTVEMFFKIIKSIAFLGEENNKNVNFYVEEYDNSKEDRYQKMLINFLEKLLPNFHDDFDNEDLEGSLNKYKESITNTPFTLKEKVILSDIVTVIIELFNRQTNKFNDYDIELTDNTNEVNDINKKLSLKINQTLDLNFISDSEKMKYLDLRIDGKKLDKTDFAILTAAIVGIKSRKDFE